MKTKTIEAQQSMTQRVAALRQLSIDTKPYISSERAELLTDFYESDVPLRESVPVCRALAFKYLVEKKTIVIGDGELIVGERGPGPKATPTYPELCCHDLEDLHILKVFPVGFAELDCFLVGFEDLSIPIGDEDQVYAVFKQLAVAGVGLLGFVEQPGVLDRCPGQSADAL